MGSVEKLNIFVKKLAKKFGYIKIVCTFASETVNVSTDGAGSSNKKIFTIMTNYEICKAFAAGNKKNYVSDYSNIFYKGDDAARTLYSYGVHFPIAKIEGGVCYFTTRGYSVSTAKHIILAESALSGFKKIYCPVPGNSRESFEYWESDLKGLEMELLTARDKARRGAAIMRIVDQIKVYCRAAGVARPGWLSKFVHVAKTLQPSQSILRPNSKQAERNWAVYSCDNGDIVSRHHTENQACKAIDKYNAHSGTFGRLAYDVRYIY